MKQNHRNVLSIVWLSMISIVVVILVCDRWFGANARSFEELSVHRINVVEADGKPRLIISDAAHSPGAIYGGKEYRHLDRESGKVPTGGMLFYNNEGDEVGAMMFAAGLKDGKQYSASHLLFDQYRQDETLELGYEAWKGVHDAGLKVMDQPDESIMPIIALGDRAARASTKEERDSILQQMKEAGKNPRRYTERFYAGKRSGSSIVSLADNDGKPRLILMVSADGKPSVVFLNAAGKTVKSIVP